MKKLILSLMLLATVTVRAELTWLSDLEEPKKVAKAEKKDQVFFKVQEKSNIQMKQFNNDIITCIANPTVEGIRDLRAILYGLQEKKNKIMEMRYNIGSKKTDRSIPSNVLASNKRFDRSVDRLRALLDEARVACRKNNLGACKIKLKQADVEFLETERTLTALMSDMKKQ
jgi:hypothetical protein